MPIINKQVRGPLPRQGSSDKAVQDTRSVMDRIAPIGFNDSDGIKLLLYGVSGTGKTTVAATFPKPLLYVVCSGGVRPGELRSIDTPEYRESIRQVVLYRSAEFLEIVDWLRASELSSGSGYGTVVLDHASGLQDLILKEILGLDELPAQRTWGMATRDHYGQCSIQCKEMLRAVLGLSCNVVIVAQERDFEKGPETSEVSPELVMPTVGAGVMPSIAQWLNPAVDYICQTFKRQKEELKRTTIGKGDKAKVMEARVKTGKVEYCLRTGPHVVFTTKFRVPRGTELPDAIVDPDYTKIMELIRGEREEKSDGS